MAYLQASLEEKRSEQGIPGMAVGVVYQGEVLMARGFGVTDVQSGEAVTEDTLFAVGSTTKAFTTALLASRVESGELDWDDPVSKHLPDFVLSTGEEATIRDLLSHQTGLTRMPMTWGGGHDVTVPELVAATGRAELYGEFRESWHYNNVMYAIAGSLVGDYPLVLENEILGPLGMDDSRLGPTEGMATGYRLHDGQPIAVETRDLSGAMAPAGALTSTVDDMLKWVQWQLAQEGEVRTTWEPVHELGGQISYGLGWMVVQEGHRTIIEHGGNIEAFSAHVALLPEEELGIVWMSNVMATLLQGQVRGLVVDALLGDDWWMPVGSGDLSRYLGDYDAAFMGETLSIVEKGDGLALDVPSQAVLALRPPDEEGLWALRISDQLKIEFLEEDGQVIGLVMHQGGLTMTAPREGHYSTESPARYAPFLGRYQLEEEVTEVLVVHGHLAVDIPSQLLYGLHDPNDEDLWVFMETDSIAVRFDRDENNAVSTLVFLQDGEETPAERLDDTDIDLPSPEAIRALAPPVLGPCRQEGTVDFVHQGVTGSWVTVWANGIYATRLDVGSGTDGSVVTPDQITVLSDFQPSATYTSPEFVDQAWAAHPGHVLAGELSVVGPAEVGGRPAWQLLRDTGENPDETLYLAQDNGDLLMRELELVSPHIAKMRFAQSQTFGDHRDGVPWHIEMENQHTGRSVMETTSLICSDDLEISSELLPEPATTTEPPAETEQDAGEKGDDGGAP